MLQGIDISMHNGNSVSLDYNFVIMKASEGVGYKDPLLDSHYDRLSGRKDGQPCDKLYGFYHYARPDLSGNSAEAEADWFVSLVGHHKGHCIYCLDWEGKSLNHDVAYAKAWLDRVYAKTGVKPLIYLQGSEAVKSKYKIISDADYGLWVAHWGVNDPSFSNWKFWALWQYQGSPLDKNYFNGTSDQFKKYCTSSLVSITISTELKVNDKVKVTKLVDYNGKILADFVIKNTYEVMEIEGDRVVIGINGAVTCAIRKDYLKKI